MSTAAWISEQYKNNPHCLSDELGQTIKDVCKETAKNVLFLGSRAARFEFQDGSAIILHERDWHIGFAGQHLHCWCKPPKHSVVCIAAGACL